jgi:hypothetical protein
MAASTLSLPAIAGGLHKAAAKRVSATYFIVI